MTSTTATQKTIKDQLDELAVDALIGVMVNLVKKEKELGCETIGQFADIAAADAQGDPAAMVTVAKIFWRMTENVDKFVASLDEAKEQSV